MVDIQSPSNDRIKALVRLWDRRERDATGTFLIEGKREVERATDAGVELVESYLCPELGMQTGGATPVTVSKTVFTKVSRRQNPDGVLAVAKQWATDLGRLQLSSATLLLVVEAIEKPGNLGAMLRVADGAGLDAVVVCDPVVDIFNPNVIRASQGSVFTVPVGVAAVDDVVAWLESGGTHVVATFPDAAEDYATPDYSRPTAIVVGAESTGLSEKWRGIGTPVSLPMAGAADSLNAATTAAIVAYEAVRQRSG